MTPPELKRALSSIRSRLLAIGKDGGCEEACTKAAEDCAATCDQDDLKCVRACAQALRKCRQTCVKSALEGIDALLAELAELEKRHPTAPRSRKAAR